MLAEIGSNPMSYLLVQRIAAARQISGLPHQLSDDGQLHESDWTEVLRLFKKAVKQGSDAARMRQEFPELLERFGAE